MEGFTIILKSDEEIIKVNILHFKMGGANWFEGFLFSRIQFQLFSINRTAPRHSLISVQQGQAAQVKNIFKFKVHGLLANGLWKTTCFFHLIYQLTTNNPIVMENVTCKPRATYRKYLTKEPKAMKMFEAYTHNSNKNTTTKICRGTRLAWGETSSKKRTSEMNRFTRVNKGFLCKSTRSFGSMLSPPINSSNKEGDGASPRRLHRDAWDG